MNCKSLINEFLHDYQAGILPLARRIEFEFHLTLCRDCRRYVDSYNKTIGLAKSSAESDVAIPPKELVEAILRITRHD